MNGSKRWEDNIGEWTHLKLCEAVRASEDREGWRGMERAGQQIVCGAPTTLQGYGIG